MESRIVCCSSSYSSSVFSICSYPELLSLSPKCSRYSQIWLEEVMPTLHLEQPMTLTLPVAVATSSIITPLLYFLCHLLLKPQSHLDNLPTLSKPSGPGQWNSRGSRKVLYMPPTTLTLPQLTHPSTPRYPTPSPSCEFLCSVVFQWWKLTVCSFFRTSRAPRHHPLPWLLHTQGNTRRLLSSTWVLWSSPLPLSRHPWRVPLLQASLGTRKRKPLPIRHDRWRCDCVWTWENCLSGEIIY